MKVGYIRVSKQEQNEALQRDALKEAGCEKYFSDKVTGAKFERKGLEELMAFVRPGDTVVVWKLDRLGRSLKDLIETLNLLKQPGGERSAHDPACSKRSPAVSARKLGWRCSVASVVTCRPCASKGSNCCLHSITPLLVIPFFPLFHDPYEALI